MTEFILMGRSQDVFKELAFIAQLELAIGHVLVKYQPKVYDNRN